MISRLQAAAAMVTAGAVNLPPAARGTHSATRAIEKASETGLSLPQGSRVTYVGLLNITQLQLEVF